MAVTHRVQAWQMRAPPGGAPHTQRAVPTRRSELPHANGDLRAKFAAKPACLFRQDQTP